MIGSLVLLCTLFTIIGVLIKPRFDTFKSRNIPHHPWNWHDFKLYRNVHFNHVLQKVYDASKSHGPVYGFFLGFTPLFMVNDLKLWRTICIKDFDYFVNRGLYHSNRAEDTVDENLLTMSDEKWRRMRQKMSPQFSSGKIKAMLPTFLEISNTLNQVLFEASQKSIDWSSHDVFQRFTSDLVGRCAFGLDCNGLRSLEGEFLKFGRIAAKSASDLSTLQGLFKMECKEFCRFLGLSRYPRLVAEFFSHVVKQTVEFREQNKVAKEDIMNALIKLKNAEEEYEKLTVDQITAQCYIFFVGGYESASSSLNYIFYYLAIRLDLQERVREDIKSVLKGYDGQITYEALQEMSTLEKFILEILRRHPISTVVIRQASMDYRVPDTNVVIKKGEYIMAPMKPIQMDPENYPDPEELDIERDFRDLLNFGVGPRMCIAERFALMQLKVVVANFLKDFQISATENTPKTLEFPKRSRFLTSTQRFHLNIQRL